MGVAQGSGNGGVYRPAFGCRGLAFLDDRESDNPIPREEWAPMWKRLVNRSGGKPGWFTEATRYREFEHDTIDETLAAVGRLEANLQLDGTVTVRAEHGDRKASIDRAWLSGPLGNGVVELTAGTELLSAGAGRVDRLPVAGSLYRGIGYYNDTQHRHEPELHLVREEKVADAVVDWARALQVESAVGGVMVVKESHKCVNRSGGDTGAFLIGDHAVEVTGWGLGLEDLKEDEWRRAWATWTVVYNEPTADSRPMALKRFDRVRYPPDAALDLYLKANTWGSGIDQPASLARASEAGILAELDSVADLGLDTLQIDDGWQVGRMRKEAEPMEEWRPRQDWYPQGGGRSWHLRSGWAWISEFGPQPGHHSGR